MVLLIIILVILFSLIFWLLFSPLKIVINTWQNKYLVRALGVVQVVLVPTEDFFIIRTQVPFHQFEYNPLLERGKKKKKEKPKSKDKKVSSKKKKKRMSREKVFKFLRLGPRLLGTFHINYMDCVLDTGDMVLNARLVPVLLPFNNNRMSVRTTFNGGGGLAVDIDNRLSRILYQGFRVFVLNK